MPLCKQCNCEFKKKSSRKTNVFCSVKCRTESTRKGRYSNCLFCDKEIYIRPCEENIKKFCSMSCSAFFNARPERGGSIYVQCYVCKKIFKKFISRIIIQKFKKNCCSKDCSKKIYGFQKTKRPKQKYVQINVNGKKYLEHRWIMEQYLGRKLSSEEHIHHKNGNGQDNRIENLMIISNSEHRKLEVAEGKSAPSIFHKNIDKL